MGFTNKSQRRLVERNYERMVDIKAARVPGCGGGRGEPPRAKNARTGERRQTRARYKQVDVEWCKEVQLSSFALGDSERAGWNRSKLLIDAGRLGSLSELLCMKYSIMVTTRNVYHYYHRLF